MLLRAGLTGLLTDGGFEVAAAVDDGDDLLPTATEHRRVLAVLRYLRT